jgi:hypothetical protein
MGLYSSYNNNRKKKAMTKKTKKPKLVVDNKQLAQDDAYYEEESNRVYVFNNVMFNFSMYINASTADEAMERFDQCGFEHREQWKIMVELSHQPSDIN